MAKLRYFHGPMSAGKSTVALQTLYNYRLTGKPGMLLSQLDRGGEGKVTSRIGIHVDAYEFTPDTDLFEMLSSRVGVDGFAVVDEAQFLTRSQVLQLARVVDSFNVSVDCFGLTTDFRGCLFDGSVALFALADETVKLPVPVFCWCGKEGFFNARVVDGRVVHEGDQIVVGDVSSGNSDVNVVTYRVLCRAHWQEKTLG